MSQNQIKPFEKLRKLNPELAEKYSDLWEKAISIMRTDITGVSINTWLKDVYIISIENNNITLCVNDDFHMDIVSGRYGGFIKKAFDNILECDCNISYISNENALFDASDNNENKNSAASEKNIIPASVDDYEYTFENFIVGNSNRFAHAACLSVANTPSSSYNPLFIYGGSGLGKTHLLYAIMHHIKNNFQSYKVVYLKGDDFTNELITAIQNGKHVEFRSRYRYADLFLVDDIQFIAGKEMTQEEFFHTFNTLYEAKKQIVLTSDRPPKEISLLEERLRTRFEWGLLADIQPPDYETRVAIVKKNAEESNITISDDITAFICNNVKTNIRQLEGTVKKLKAFYQLTGCDINMQIAQNAVKDMFTECCVTVITPEKIIAEVSQYYNISPKDIISKKRTADITRPRQVAMYITREITDLSLPGIGQAFGGRDHTTVIHSVNKIEDEMQKNLRLKQLIMDLVKNIKGN